MTTLRNPVRSRGLCMYICCNVVNIRAYKGGGADSRARAWRLWALVPHKSTYHTYGSVECSKSDRCFDYVKCTYIHDTDVRGHDPYIVAKALSEKFPQANVAIALVCTTWQSYHTRSPGKTCKQTSLTPYERVWSFISTLQRPLRQALLPLSRPYHYCRHQRPAEQGRWTCVHNAYIRSTYIHTVPEIR